MHFACYSCWYMIIVPDAYSMLQVLVHDDYIPNVQLHVAGVSTWWLYHLHNCMLLDLYNNIPNCDCEHGISYYSTYRSRLCFFTHRSFLRGFRFFLFLLSYLQFEFLSVNVSLEFVGFRICRPLQLSDSSCIFFLNWDLHTCRYGYNRYL